ncbi:MAG: hypothetical protein KAH57_10795 [Thermoplasmata archaeon]|nr:hypothetical protein [Thermoplasmata archaeon]
MEERGEKLKGDGLIPPWSRQDGIRVVPGAFRPMDQLLKERLHALKEDLCSLGIEYQGGFALAIRSISGFYCTRRNSSLLDIAGDDLIDVIDYDPTRRWLIASEMGDIDPMVEVFWFGTRAFPEDMIYCITSKDEEFTLLSDTVGRPRIDKILSIMKKWKDNRVSRIDNVLLWRGGDLGSLKKFLVEHYSPENDQRSQ